MAVPTSEQGSSTFGPFWHVDEEETPELQWPQNVQVYDRMRRQDSQVISVIRAVTLPIRRTEWRIEQGEASDEVAAFVAANLGLPLAGQKTPTPVRTRDRFSWGEHLRHALLMLTFGHSFFEQVYRLEEGKYRLRKLAWRPPRTISQIDVAPDGGLLSISQTAAGTAQSAKINVDRLVAYVNEREGGNWLGSSLLRPAYKFWLLKDRLLRVQAQTADRNGLGVPVYESSPLPDTISADDAKARQENERKEGLALARSFRSGSSAGAWIPNGAKLTLKGVEGNLPDVEKPIRYYDEQIARAVLAHFLNLGTETGSWALGSTLADFFTLSLQTVGNQIADVTNQHVIEDLVDINFGENVPAPRIVFDEIGSRHPATAEGIRALVQCGALTPDEPLEEYVRITFGLPDRDRDQPRNPLGQPETLGEEKP